MAKMTHVLVMLDLRLFVMPKTSVNDNVRLDRPMKLRVTHAKRSLSLPAHDHMAETENAVRDVLAGMSKADLQALLDEIASAESAPQTDPLPLSSEQVQ